MPGIVKARLAMFLTGLVVVPIATVLVILFAKGYRPDFQRKEFLPTGLLVAHSYPEGAQVVINGQVKSATNTTVNLPPGDYQIEIKKDGYYTWNKQLTIEAEIVTRATASLFPSVPTLKPITTQGADHPTLSPDGTKVAFTSLDSRKLYLLDLNESPLGLINRESKLITQTAAPIMTIKWSPDSRQVLVAAAAASASAYLIDINSLQTKLVSPADPSITTAWTTILSTREAQKFAALPAKLQEVFATSAADLLWSPREDKILYTATSSAALPDELKKPLPGSNTQTQLRQLTPGSIYVYDIEEDRNFKIAEISLPSPTPKPVKKNAVLSPLPAVNTPNAGLLWFTSSSHLVQVDPGKITIFEYDGQNPTVVYVGPLEKSLAIPYPSAKQMLILANLTTTPSPNRPSLSNLYALTLR